MLPLLVVALTGSGIAMGIVGVLQLLPDLLLGLPAGALADRWDRRRMIIVADLGRAALTFAAFFRLPYTLGIVALSVAACYSALTLLALALWHLRKPEKAGADLPPVTVLKPLCGAEPGLYEHLRGFCEQAYPEYQVVFGMRDPADPADTRTPVTHRAPRLYKFTQ